MANANRPCGLVPLEYISGAPYTGKARMFCIPNSDDTNAYAIGDPVMLAGGADDRGVATVTLASAGSTNLILGAIVGMAGSKYGGPGAVPGELETTVVPAVKNRDYYVLVSDDPNIVYMVMEENTGTALTAAAVGLNGSLVAGTNNGYISGWVLDNDNEATTQALQVKLLGLVQMADNDFGLCAKWKVLINNHAYHDGQAGV